MLAVMLVTLKAYELEIMLVTLKAYELELTLVSLLAYWLGNWKVEHLLKLPMVLGQKLVPMKVI